MNKPKEIIDVGFYHSEQIDIIKYLQDKYISYQSIYFKEYVNACRGCRGCGVKLCEHKANFQAVFKDHKIPTRR